MSDYKTIVQQFMSIYCVFSRPEVKSHRNYDEFDSDKYKQYFFLHNN